MVLRSVTNFGFITKEQRKKQYQCTVLVTFMPPSSSCCSVAVSSAMERECYTVPLLSFSVITIHEAIL